MEDSSLSQGIFFQKPKRKRKASGYEKLQLEFGDIFEKFETATLRQNTYIRHLTHIREKIEHLEKTWHSEVVDEVVSFIDDSSTSMFQSELITPIGFLQSGLSADENKMLFDSIQNAIQEGKTPYLARLSSTTCPNVKTAFQNICKQLIRSDTNVSYFPEETGAGISMSSLPDDYSPLTSSSKYLSIHDLQQWYEVGQPKYFKNSFMKNSPSLENKHRDSNFLPSPITRRGSTTPKRVGIDKPCFMTPKSCTPFRNSTPKTGRHLSVGNTMQRPIVLIIEDVDYCPSNVIQQILQLLSCAKLPMILIVGVINCYESFNRFIPQQCSTTLMYKAFTTITASKRLNDFFVKILFDIEFPFVLSGNVVEYMSDYFLLHNFSATRLLQAYQLCLIDFYSEAKSILCTGGNNLTDVSCNDLSEVLKAADVRKTKHKSVKTSPKSKEPLSDSGDIKNGARELVKHFNDSAIEWFVALHFFFAISEKLPNSSAKDIRELYILCYDGGLFQDREDGQMKIEDTLEVIRIFSRRQLETRLETALIYIKEFLKDNDLTETEEVLSLFSDVENFIFKLKHCDEEEKLQSTQASMSSAPDLNLKKKKFRATELRDVMKKEIENKKTGKVFIELRTNFIQFVRTFTKKHLSAFHAKPNAKIFTFDNLNYLQHYFSPCPQRRISSALSLPGKFLSCRCCSEISLGSMNHSLPDTSIVYKLIMERNTKMLDLNELYQSFESIIGSRGTGTPKKHGKINDPYLLRFRQTIAELQHMGFIQRSKRKPDEITRQNW